MSMSESQISFEKWFIKFFKHDPSALEKCDCNHYKVNYAEGLWICWQASRTVALEDAAKAMEPYPFGDRNAQIIRAMKGEA